MNDEEAASPIEQRKHKDKHKHKHKHKKEKQKHRSRDGGDEPHREGKKRSSPAESCSDVESGEILDPTETDKATASDHRLIPGPPPANRDLAAAPSAVDEAVPRSSAREEPGTGQADTNGVEVKHTSRERPTSAAGTGGVDAVTAPSADAAEPKRAPDALRSPSHASRPVPSSHAEEPDERQSKRHRISRDGASEHRREDREPERDRHRDRERDRDREKDRDRSRRHDSSSRADKEASHRSSREPQQLETSGDREAGGSRRDSDRGRHAAGGHRRDGSVDRSRGRDRSRERDRGGIRERSRHISRERDRERDHERSRARESEPGRRRSEDERKRRSRSRSRSRSGDRHGSRRDERASKRHEVDRGVAGNGKQADDEPSLDEFIDPEEEERRRLEESRRRRQEILMKHRQQQQQQQGGQQQQQEEQQEQQQGPASAAGDAGSDVSLPPRAPSTSQQQQEQQPASSDSMGSENSDELAGAGQVYDIFNAGAALAGTSAGGAAADMEVSSRPPVPASEPAQSHVADIAARAANKAAAVQKPPADDMFADDDGADDDGVDMFAEEADEQQLQQAAAAAPAQGLADAYDDPEGYYNFQVGEVMDSRYEVVEFKGKGVFSSVVRARDLKHRDAATGEHPEVAIKLIRANETMYKAAQTEQAILRQLAAADPENKKHCIRLLRAFEYRNHMCLATEMMDMNLRELTNKYGRGVGLNINAVGLYTSQLLLALRHMRRCGVLHADIKPDNILVNARRTRVKVCDFGSAMSATEHNEITPYLQSRFYRAPEVMLGLKYDYPMDVWSIGCVIYELFTGRILFPGKSNNEMLKLMQEVKGPLPRKMVKKGMFADKHFELDDPSMAFASLEEDPITRQPVRRLMPNIAGKTPFSVLLARGSGGACARTSQLADLLEKMMALDPDKRLDPEGALRHPFVREHLPKKGKGKGV